MNDKKLYCYEDPIENNISIIGIIYGVYNPLVDRIEGEIIARTRFSGGSRRMIPPKGTISSVKTPIFFEITQENRKESQELVFRHLESSLERFNVFKKIEELFGVLKDE